MEANQEIILKTLKRMFNGGGGLKDGVKMIFDNDENTFVVISEGGAFYSLKTNDFDKALLKFYTKEILSDREAKHYFDSVKEEIISEEE